MEPGRALVNLVAQMKELNELVYIAPEKCVSRCAELSGEKREMVLAVEAKTVTVKQKDADTLAELDSGLDVD
eukprot:6260014-Amphidinium_carterae.1